jgi:CO/xanthine dehydrogenase Mo-binding subunit
MSKYSVVGRRLPRVDALSKVTGEALFSGDITLPRMLQGQVLRSPYPHAVIRRLEVKKAQGLNSPFPNCPTWPGKKSFMRDSRWPPWPL